MNYKKSKTMLHLCHPIIVMLILNKRKNLKYRHLLNLKQTAGLKNNFNKAKVRLLEIVVLY